MKRSWFLLLALLIPLILTACNRQTALSFDNQTECGVATIKITDMSAGSIKEYSLDEEDALDIEIKPNVTYRYEVTYGGREGIPLNCEPKSGTIMIPNRGQTSNFTLVSVTPTPAAG